MEVINIGEQNSLSNHFLMEMRDKNKQQDRMRFRKNAERLGSIMAYEISKKLSYSSMIINTPLEEHATEKITQQPVLVTIMRAGIPYFTGFQNFFDQADSGFIGAYRKEGEKELTIKLDYFAAPKVSNKTVILIDPMLATGKSMVDSIAELQKAGNPEYLHIATLVAAPEGIEYLRKHEKVPTTLWTFAIDKQLNANFYIVPGLGDAGDLSFGEKI